MSTAFGIGGVFALLLSGMWLAAVMDRTLASWVSGGNISTALRGAHASGALHLLRQSIRTERPDAINAALAPVLYAALAAIGLSVVPFAPGVVVTQISTGIVLWGACEALTIVAVFLHGWSTNAPLPLIGAYR